jgi:hypothetical protein
MNTDFSVVEKAVFFSNVFFLLLFFLTFKCSPHFFPQAAYSLQKSLLSNWVSKIFLNFIM